MPIPECNQLERKLEAAVRRFVDERSLADRRRRTGLELRFLFAHLGVSLADLDALSASPDALDLCPSLRARLIERLATERRRLKRLARSGSALYDAGRHLALRTAVGWLENDHAAGPSIEEEQRPSGAMLNSRFRRPGPRLAPRAKACITPAVA